MIAIGIGCRKGCEGVAIEALVRRALMAIDGCDGSRIARTLSHRERVSPEAAGEGSLSRQKRLDFAVTPSIALPLSEFVTPHPATPQPPSPFGRGCIRLFTITDKKDEPGLAAAAASLALPLVFLDHACLQKAAPRASTSSARVETLFGLPSIAETAALAGAGEKSILLLPRISEGGASCAIARSEMP